MLNEDQLISEKYRMFDVENRLSDNYFWIENGEKKYIVRLFPLAIYEIEGSPKEALNLIADQKVSFQETPPFSYYQPLLILTNACDLACSYCYAYQGSYGMSVQTMPKDVITHTINYLSKTLIDHFSKQVEKDKVYEIGAICFGGEPLLALQQVKYVFESISRICDDLARRYQATFKPLVTVNTNGYAISPEAIQFLKDMSPFLELVVSYDGWTHDKYRLTKNGGKSSSNVSDFIFRIKEMNVDVSVTACIVPEATRVPEQTLGSLNKFLEKQIPINLSFIRGPLETVKDRALYPGKLQEAYGTEELDQFGETVARYILNGAPIYSRRFRRRLLEGGYRYRCGAGLFEFAVMPNGKVYPCHNFVTGGFEIGQITEPGFAIGKDSNLVDSLMNRKVGNLVPCRDCVLQSTCMSSFDCPAHSLQDLGNISLVDSRFCGFARKVQTTILKQTVLGGLL